MRELGYTRSRLGGSFTQPLTVPIDPHNLSPASAEKGEDCPKCGAVMEPIDPAMEGPDVEQLQLCPTCYLVMWKDETGFQVRQGVPVPNGTKPRDEAN